MTAHSPAPSTLSLRERLRRLPKTELHLHALGSLRPATVVDFARAKNAPILEAAEQGAAHGYQFENLTTFVEFFIGLFGLVTTPAEFERVTFEILEDAARQGVRYLEPRWGPTSHLSRGATVDGMWAGLEAGRRAAARAYGIEARWIGSVTVLKTPSLEFCVAHCAPFKSRATSFQPVWVVNRPSCPGRVTPQ